jgi:NAD(P)H-dependent FMN reductase
LTTVADILLISGSLRAGSSNSALLRTAATLMPEGFRAVTYEGMADLPHFNPDDDDDPLPAVVVGLRRAIEDACVHLPVTSSMVDAEGLITDPAVRAGIARSLVALVGIDA